MEAATKEEAATKARGDEANQAGCQALGRFAASAQRPLVQHGHPPARPRDGSWQVADRWGPPGTSASPANTDTSVRSGTVHDLVAAKSVVLRSRDPRRRERASRAS